MEFLPARAMSGYGPAGRGTYTQIKTGAGCKIKNKNGPFSSVSTATIAGLGSFFSIFRDLQD